MLMGIFLLLVISALIIPDSKKLSYLLLIFMWIIYSFNTYSGDYEAYERVYYNISEYGIFYYEILFSIIMYVCSKLGLSFILFRAILGALFLAVLNKAIASFTSYKAFTLAMFMICPFLYYVSVLRAGISAVFVLWSVHFLYKRTKPEVAKFLLCILIAFLFHYYAIFFLIMLWARKKPSNKHVLYILGGLSIILFIVRNNSFIYNILNIFTQREKTLLWFTNAANFDLNWKGVAIQILIVVINIIIIRGVKQKNSRYTSINKEEYMQYKNWLIDFTYNTNRLLIILIPFMFVNDIMMRYVWAILALNVSICANYISNFYKLCPEKKRLFGRKVPLTKIVVVLWITSLCYYINMPYIGTENSAMHLFFNNMLAI